MITALMVENPVEPPVVGPALTVVPTQQEWMVHTVVCPELDTIQEVLLNIWPYRLCLDVWCEIGILADENGLGGIGVSTLVGPSAKIETQGGGGVEGHGLG